MWLLVISFALHLIGSYRFVLPFILFTRSSYQFRNYKSEFSQFFDQFEQFYLSYFLLDLPQTQSWLKNSWKSKIRSFLVVGTGEQDIYSVPNSWACPIIIFLPLFKTLSVLHLPQPRHLNPLLPENQHLHLLHLLLAKTTLLKVFSESLEKTMFEWHHLNSLLLMICENNLSKKNPAKKSSQISRHNHQYFQMIQQRRPKAAEQIYSYFMFTITNCGNKIWHCELSSLYLLLTYTYLISVVEKLFQHLHLHLLHFSHLQSFAMRTLLMVFSESLEKTMFKWHHLNSLLLIKRWSVAE